MPAQKRFVPIAVLVFFPYSMLAICYMTGSLFVNILDLVPSCRRHFNRARLETTVRTPHESVDSS